MSPEALSPPDDFLNTYRHNRLGFVRHVLKIDPVEWQAEELAALDNGCLRLSIRSGHGVGKSAFLSWVMTHFLVTRWPVKIVATAPSAPQLFDALAAETKFWVNQLPDFLRELFEVSSDRIYWKKSPEAAYCSFRTARADVPEALQGIHAANVLLIVDEASGVPEPIFECRAD